MRLAVVLFNLGGPDCPEAVRPFLQNLFSDPAIISLPGFLRRPLAQFIAGRRAPLARTIYGHIGGRSPILAETEEQARALEEMLGAVGHDVKCFIAMRYWHPFTRQAVEEVKTWAPERIVLLPLYPQYSTTTTRSSLSEWRKEARRARLEVPQHEICCYPFEPGFVAALADMVSQALERAKRDVSYRVLFSAHGLPKRVVDRGDPYQKQVERTVEAVLTRLDRSQLDAGVCYQSRVGPLEWIGPDTDAEIRRAGQEGKGVIVVPVAFVSEHSETLVELDIEYARVAKEAGAPDYIRVPTVRTHPSFIEALASLVNLSVDAGPTVVCTPGHVCPQPGICGKGKRPSDV